MVVESSPTSHFTQNFALYKVGSLESNLHRDFVYLKTLGFSTLARFPWILLVKILEKVC